MFRENSIETNILSRVKQTISPGWMHETSAQGWCTRKTWGDGDEEHMLKKKKIETLGWMKHKRESRLPGEILITSDMQMTPPLWQKAKKN